MLSLGLGVAVTEVGPPFGSIIARVKAGDSYAALGGVASFTRADATTCATQDDAVGTVQTVLANVLRDTHYVGGVRTILLEPTRETEVIKSDALDTVLTWVPGFAGGGTIAAVTANQGIAPDGTNTADKLVFVAPIAGDQSFIQQSPLMASVIGSTYAGFLYVKAFAAGDIGKTILIRAGSAAFTPIVLSAVWQRLGASVVAAAVTSGFYIGLRPALGSSSGTVSLLAWRPTFELGAYPSSSLGTDVLSVVRAVDALSFTGITTVRPSTVFYRYWDLATSAWANEAAAYASAAAITPAIERAYAEIAILGGSLSAAQAAARLGY